MRLLLFLFVGAHGRARLQTKTTTVRAYNNRARLQQPCAPTTSVRTHMRYFAGYPPNMHSHQYVIAINPLPQYFCPRYRLFAKEK